MALQDVGLPKARRMGKEDIKSLNEDDKELHMPISEGVSKKEILKGIRKILNY